jgi:competence protein ComEC
MQMAGDAMRDSTPALTTPLYWLVLGLLLGQVAAAAASRPLLGAGSAALAVAAALASRRRRRLLPLALAAAAFAAGHAQHAAVLRRGEAAGDIAAWHGARAWVRGTVVEATARGAAGTRLVIEVSAARRGGDWSPAHGGLQVGIEHPHLAWRRGDAIEALLAPRAPRNFGNPGEFDYRGYLARRGITATAFAPDDRGWRRRAAAANWHAPLDRWRAATAAVLSATLAPDDAAIARALIIGDMAGLDDARRTRYARAGVSHVLSISGLHVGLVAAAAYGLVRRLLARSERLLLTANVPKLAMAASLAPLALYAAIAGDNVATLRAELMAVLVAAGLLLDRPREWMAPVAAAAGGLVLLRPGAAADISFQLSFAAVLAIVLGVPRLTACWDAWEEAHLIRLRHPRWRWLRWLVLSQSVTVCAAIGTAPLGAWHFNQISLIAPIANLVVVPLLGIVTVAAGLLGTAAVALWPAAAPPLFLLVGIAIRIADRATGWLAAWPWAAVRVPTPSAWELVLLYAALGGLLVPRRRLAAAIVATAVAALAVDAATWVIERHAAGTLRVTFVSVGQGDCTVIEFPRRQVWVVDGGGLAGSRLDVGERVVAPVLWRRKIMRLDALVLSHADYDHAGGLAFLAASFAPPRLWWNGHPGRGSGYAALQRALARGHVLREVPVPGRVVDVDGVAVRVLHPDPSDPGSDNDRSLTLQLRYGPTTILLPGDVEAAGEAALVGRWGAALRSTVLKVPHHGSATSSTPAFLDAVAPRIAVVSAGADNRFGFPAPAVERAYAARGTTLWRTDRDGAVALVIDARGGIAMRGGRGRAVALDSLDSQKIGSLKGGVAEPEGGRRARRRRE